MKHGRLTIALLALTVALPIAAETVDRSFDVGGDFELDLEMISARVELTGWDRETVRVQGTYDGDFEELEIEAGGDEMRIELQPLRGEWNDRHDVAEFEISLPRTADLRIEAISGDFTIRDVEGSLQVEVISGDVRISGAREDVEVEAISGSVELETSPGLRSVDLSAVSGNLELRGELDPLGRYNLESLNGSVTLYVSDGASAEFEVETFSGDIRSDFGKVERTSEFMNSKALQFSVGSGEARVSVSSFSGTVRIERD